MSLIVKNLTFTYPNGLKALDDISFTIKQGEFVCITGLNGSGKTTLAKVLANLLIPDSGSIDSSCKPGLVFQNPENQFVNDIVEEDVAFGLENHCVKTELIRQKVDEVLSLAELYDKRVEQIKNLSGGEKQKVAVSGILAMQNNCIVLDEPTSMLDPDCSAVFMKKLKEINEKTGCTVILITQKQDDLLYSERVIVLKEGKMALDSDTFEALDSGKLEDLGLEIPELVKVSKHLGLNVRSFDIDTIAEEIYLRWQKRMQD